MQFGGFEKFVFVFVTASILFTVFVFVFVFVIVTVSIFLTVFVFVFVFVFIPCAHTREIIEKLLEKFCCIKINPYICTVIPALKVPLRGLGVGNDTYILKGVFWTLWF